MAFFKIDGKEYELKLTFKSIEYLNSQFEGGSYELIGLAIQGDFEAFPKIIHAGLFHTEENFSLAEVTDEIEKLINDEKISLEDVAKICDEVVTQSFFYRETVDKLMKNNPEMKKALDQLRG